MAIKSLELSVSTLLIVALAAGASPTAAEQDADHRSQPIRLVTQIGHSGWINSVALSSGGTCFLTGSTDGSARLWDARKGRLLRLVRTQLKRESSNLGLGVLSV